MVGGRGGGRLEASEGRPPLRSGHRPVQTEVGNVALGERGLEEVEEAEELGEDHDLGAGVEGPDAVELKEDGVRLGAGVGERTLEQLLGGRCGGWGVGV